MKNGKGERKGEKERRKAKRWKEKRGRKEEEGERKEMLGTVWALESARWAATATCAGVPVSEHLSSSTTSRSM